jgi:hypothetical protein
LNITATTSEAITTTGNNSNNPTAQQPRPQHRRDTTTAKAATTTGDDDAANVTTINLKIPTKTSKKAVLHAPVYRRRCNAVPRRWVPQIAARVTWSVALLAVSAGQQVEPPQQQHRNDNAMNTTRVSRKFVTADKSKQQRSLDRQNPNKRQTTTGCKTPPQPSQQLLLLGEQQ